MCLFVDLKLPDVDRTKAGEITKLARNKNLYPLQAIRVEKKVHECHFLFSSHPDHPCACELLTEESDFRNETWKLKSDRLESIARTIQFLANHGSKKMYFEAAWHGSSTDKPLKTLRAKIELDDFIGLLQSNRISTHTIYEISLGAG